MSAEQVSPVKKSSPRPDLMSREKAIKHASQAQRFLLPVNDTSRKPKKKSCAPCLLLYCFISILLLCNQETALFGGKVLMWFNVENNLKKKKVLGKNRCTLINTGEEEEIACVLVT